jgi:formylmethanofuran dehydrogenase subunit E
VDDTVANYINLTPPAVGRFHWYGGKEEEVGMIGISAQVSLYPLGQETLSSTIDEALHIIQEHELEVRPGAMSTVISGETSVVFQALQRAFEHSAIQGEAVMVVTFSNACPVSPKEEQEIPFTAIGHVENQFDDPVSSSQIRETESRIVLNPDLVEGLQGIEAGQKLMVLYHFHLSNGFDLLQHPRGEQGRSKRGVFTLRSPRRPNPIGLTEVDLLEINENVLRVHGLDAINGTPVLDLKPVLTGG